MPRLYLLQFLINDFVYKLTIKARSEADAIKFGQLIYKSNTYIITEI